MHVYHLKCETIIKQFLKYNQSYRLLIVLTSNLDFNKTSMFLDKIHVWSHDDQEVNKQWSILTVKLLYLTFEITTKTLSQ